MTEYANGTPSWVDLSTSDPEGSERFYTELFGWELAEPRAPEFGGYRNFHDAEGRLIAGLNPMGQVAAWSTYVSVDSADETAAKVRDAGGTLMFEPMDVGPMGRMAVCVDPQGAVFGLWQPGMHRGAEKVNEPVSLCWNELHTTDREAAKAFYAAVFGWGAADDEVGGHAYTVFDVGGRPVGGAGSEAEASHWLVWFAVEDTDATISRAQGLGATLRSGPTDVDTVGRTAVLADPQGAVFGVLRGEAPDE